MPDYSDARKTNLSEFEQQEQFLLHAKGEIVHVLNDLSRKPDIITGYFDRGERYLLTAVLAVLAERGLVVLDYGPDETLNEALLRSGRLVCATKHERIHIKFTLEGVQRARFQGKPVFAAPLPETVFRLQRREYFRVRTPITTPVTCEVPWGDERRQLVVADVGYGGLALVDDDCSYPGDLNDVLKGCVLTLPGNETLQVDLEVRNRVPLRHKDGAEFQRIGCQFVQLPLQHNVVIQRYIHQLQVAQKQIGG